MRKELGYISQFLIDECTKNEGEVIFIKRERERAESIKIKDRNARNNRVWYKINRTKKGKFCNKRK